MEEIKTSADWYKEEDGLKILEPNGWDRSDFEHSFDVEEITKEEFDSRVLFSICDFGKNSAMLKKVAKLRGIL